MLHYLFGMQRVNKRRHCQETFSASRFMKDVSGRVDL